MSNIIKIFIKFINIYYILELKLEHLYPKNNDNQNN